MGDAAGLPAAAAAGSGGGSPLGTVALLAAGASQRLAALSEGGPHSWGALALVFWVVWLCMQGTHGSVVGFVGAQNAQPQAPAPPPHRAPILSLLSLCFTHSQ